MTETAHIILSGGSGTRLWPMSRKNFPKQFIPLGDGLSLFQKTVLRLETPGKKVIVTNADHRFFVSQQMQAIGYEDFDVLIEPSPKSTAPSILLACHHLNAINPSMIVTVLPSDHLVEDREKFNTMISKTCAEMTEGQLVCFGVKPDRPETGYGYIEYCDSDQFIRPVSSFVEKPDLKTAQHFLSSEQYLWNAGIFVFRVRDILEIAHELRPEMNMQVKKSYDNRKTDYDYIRANASSWDKIDQESFDYAFMENAQSVGCVSFSGSWSDVGSWETFSKGRPQDASGNIHEGSVEHIDCSDSILWSSNKGQLLTAIGLQNIVAISTDDAVMIAERSKLGKLGTLVADIKAKGHAQAEHSNRDYRPWGWFETLLQGDNFKVKLLHIHIGGSLSLQSHKMRYEHWVVVKGECKVIKEDKDFNLKTNQSIFISVGEKHKLINTGSTVLEIVEVQTGDYLGEDDIVRYEDQYGRKE